MTAEFWSILGISLYVGERLLHRRGRQGLCVGCLAGGLLLCVLNAHDGLHRNQQQAQRHERARAANDSPQAAAVAQHEVSDVADAESEDQIFAHGKAPNPFSVAVTRAPHPFGGSWK